MARRGTFGRTSRAWPNLTATIVAIAREMQAQEDANINSAWQNGGVYEGNKVTDNMILAHYDERLKNLSPDDPAYDEAKNNIMQLQFTIGESKAKTLYAQGKLDDNGMAQFYLNWAKKVPKDSEFYRKIQQAAAGLLQSAASKGRAAAAKAKKDAFNKFADDTTQRYIALGDTLTQVMVQIARDNNVIGQNQDLSDFALKGENDPGRMEYLLNLINDDMKANPAKYATLVTAIKKYDPNWDGNLTSAYFAKALAGQVTGYGLIQARALKDGFTAKATSAGKSLTAANTLGAEVKSFPVAAAYSTARAQFDAVWKSPAATDADKAKAAGDFAIAIDGFSKTPGLDPAMANRLINDAAALRGDPGAANQPSFYESYLGTTSPNLGATNAGGSTTGENAGFAQDIARIDFWRAQYDANPGAYVYASSKTDSQGNPAYDPTGNGPIGVVPTASVSAAPGNNSIIPVPLITGGTIMQVVSKKDIVFDGADGSSIVVGLSMTYNQGGITKTLYGVTRPDGTTDWTPVSPFAQGVNETFKPDGIHLTINPSSDPTYLSGVAAAADAAFGTNVAASFANGAVPADGMTWRQHGTQVASGTAGTRTDHVVTWKNGQLSYAAVSVAIDVNANGASYETGSVSEPSRPVDQSLTGAGLVNTIWDQARLANGPNPQIDFTMPTMAALVTSHATGVTVSDLWGNPVFQAQLQAQEIREANGDPAKFAQIQAVDAGVAAHMAAFAPDSVYSTVTPASLAAARKIVSAYNPYQDSIHNQTIPPINFSGQSLKVPGYGTPGQGAVGHGLLDVGQTFLNNMPSWVPVPGTTQGGALPALNPKPPVNPLMPGFTPPAVLPTSPVSIPGLGGKIIPAPSGSSTVSPITGFTIPTPAPKTIGTGRAI